MRHNDTRWRWALIRIICNDDDWDELPITQMFRTMNTARRKAKKEPYTRITTNKVDHDFVLVFTHSKDREEKRQTAQ